METNTDLEFSKSGERLLNPGTVDELVEATEELTKPVKAIRKAHTERLTFKQYSAKGETWHQVEKGILWIPPFVNDFWSGRRVKPKKAKCTCTCGHKHASKTEKAQVPA